MWFRRDDRAERSAPQRGFQFPSPVNHGMVESVLRHEEVQVGAESAETVAPARGQHRAVAEQRVIRNAEGGRDLNEQAKGVRDRVREVQNSLANVH